jgi:2-dehydropantoate 2-reductase
VEPIWGITAQRFVDAAEGRMLADVERDMAERAKELAGGRPSLLQDVMRGRRTEVQYLNGYVSEQGRQVGVATPFNDKVVELITRVPPGTLKPDPKNLDPLVKMLPK